MQPADSHSQALPPAIEHFWTIECPECGQRWLHSRWNAVAYPMHYASVHLGIAIWRRLSS